MIRWMSVFLDVPDDAFDRTLDFWTTATSTAASAPRGDRDQFVTLEPAAADAHLRMQRHEGEARTHLDLHVDEIDDTAAKATALGARVIAELGYVIMASPGGFEFCIVGHDGEHDRGERLAEPHEHRLDVICADAPPQHFEAEVAFWGNLTDQAAVRKAESPEYAGFALRHQGLPWNLLVQRLGGDDGRHSTHAHLDVSAGSALAAVVERHVALGAVVERRLDDWVVLRDPAGLAYCITNRNPD